jgi:hypothetical protein
MAGVSGVTLRLEKAVVLVGESITASGEVSPPLPMLDVYIRLNGEVIGSAKTDYMGRYSTEITLVREGDFSVTAVCQGVSSDPVPLTVRPVAPPTRPAPPAPVIVLAPEVAVRKLSDVSLDEFREMLRGVLAEAFGISGRYYFYEGTLDPGRSKDFDFLKLLGKPAWEGYIINDHDTESLWVSIDGGPWVEVAAGEVYPLYKRTPSKLTVENRSTTASIKFRLEAR